MFYHRITEEGLGKLGYTLMNTKAIQRVTDTKKQVNYQAQL